VAEERLRRNWRKRPRPREIINSIPIRRSGRAEILDHRPGNVKRAGCARRWKSAEQPIIAKAREELEASPPNDSQDAERK
jgi:hypothetical protein